MVHDRVGVLRRLLQQGMESVRPHWELDFRTRNASVAAGARLDATELERLGRHVTTTERSGFLRFP